MSISARTQILIRFAQLLVVLMVVGELFISNILVALYLKFGFTHIFWTMFYCVVFGSYAVFTSIVPIQSKSLKPAQQTVIFIGCTLAVSLIGNYLTVR